jgi:AbrB family looped-hinge helix DNA binding protein
MATRQYIHDMTTRMTAKHQVVIPSRICKRLQWKQGDDFIVEEGPDQVTLKKIVPRKKGLGKLILSCPHPIPEVHQRQLARALK